jgi:hypothetical protein
MWQLAVEKIPVQRFEALLHGVFSFTNNSKLDQHASRTPTIKPRATGLKQLDLGIDHIPYPASGTSFVKTLQLIRKYGQYHRPIVQTILLWPNEPNTREVR